MCNQPIVLLLNKNSTKNNRSVRVWLKKNGFSMKEAANAFRAMEEISDFTVRLAPEVILIEAISPNLDFDLICEMFELESISIFAISEKENVINHQRCFEGNLSEIKARFTSLHSNQAHAAIAA